MSKVIFHVDLNAFFAACEQLKNPELLGKPIAVCTDSRGAVVTTASYEARAFGVHSAMPLTIAKHKCPDLITVDADFTWYHLKSAQFIEFLRKFTTQVEQASIDEAYLDVTEIISNYDKPLQLAVDLQKGLKEKLGLNASIGIAPNKFLAKMASDQRKPLGMYVLRKREIESKLWNLSIDSMHGIGKVSSAKLKDIGINTIGDLAKTELDSLTKVLKNQAYYFQQLAHGNDDSWIETQHQVKSISSSNSLFEALHDYNEITQLIYSQIADLEKKLISENYGALNLSVSLRNDLFEQYTRSTTFNHAINNLTELYQHALLLYDSCELEGGLKYCSFTINRFQESEDQIYNLFNQKTELSTQDIIAKVNTLFDAKVLKKGREASNESK